MGKVKTGSDEIPRSKSSHVKNPGLIPGFSPLAQSPRFGVDIISPEPTDKSSPSIPDILSIRDRESSPERTKCPSVTRFSSEMDKSSSSAALNSVPPHEEIRIRTTRCGRNKTGRFFEYPVDAEIPRNGGLYLTLEPKPYGRVGSLASCWTSIKRFWFSPRSTRGSFYPVGLHRNQTRSARLTRYSEMNGTPDNRPSCRPLIYNWSIQISN